MIDTEPSDSALYDQAAWYDILHTPGTARDLEMLLRFNRDHGRDGRDFLEPACGTGRFLRLLAARGYHAVGYDSNRAALAYARRRLARFGSRVEVIDADMARFVRPASFDFAFNLINTFRHLLTGQAARAHLRNTACSLRVGGIYVLGIDLTDYDHPMFEEETFAARRGRCHVQQVMMSLPPDREERRERIINHITVMTLRGEHRFESVYDLRTYDLAQLRALLRGLPFEIAATYDFAGLPTPLHSGTRDINLVLRRIED